MYRQASFQHDLNQKYLSLNLIQIQKRKSLFPEQKSQIKKRRAITSIVYQAQINQQNHRLVQKLLEVRFNPAFVKKMYMGENPKLQKKKAKSHNKIPQLFERQNSLKHREIQQENKRLKKTIEAIKNSKKLTFFPEI